MTVGKTAVTEKTKISGCVDDTRAGETRLFLCNQPLLRILTENVFMYKILCAFLTLLITVSASAQSKNYIDQPFIEVNGKADTLVTPNEIFIRILLSEKDVKDRIALEDLELKLVVALKKLNIDTEKDLAIVGLASNFRNYILKDKDILKYKVYQLEVSDANTATKVFIALEQLGISNSFVERVGHSATEMIKNKLRNKAMLDAQHKARILAESISQQIDRAIHISDTDQSLPATVDAQTMGIRIRGLSEVVVSDKTPPQIEFNKIRISAEVTVKFTLQ